MALEEYKRKRDFSQTPEPPPKLAKGKQRRFVVQKHSAYASALRFPAGNGWRAEVLGHPQGPIARSRRQAPGHAGGRSSRFRISISRASFHAGNYGAGTVMVWDMGTWEPQGDAHEMLRKGDLKFHLEGQKLKGDFALVHMKSRRPGSKGTEWLLIKHRDAYDQPGYDIDKYD